MNTLSNCRITAVMITPFISGNTPDLAEIARYTDVLCEKPIDALLPCASTGEAVKMDASDRYAIMQTVALAAKGRKKLIAGACEPSCAGVIRDLEMAKKYGYDACLVCPPYYYGLDQKAVYDFFCEIAHASEGMPIVAYHVPFFTTGIELSTFEKILELPQILAIKDSSAVMKRIAHTCDIVRKNRPEFGVYTGTDDCLLPALTAGCRGSMTALAASLPRWISSVYRAFDEGRLSDGMALQMSALEVLRACDAPTFPIGYKLLAKATGLRITEDYGPALAAQYEKIKKLAEVLE